MHQEIKTCVICERTQDEIESQVINPEYDMQVLLTFSVIGKEKCVCDTCIRYINGLFAKRNE